MSKDFQLKFYPDSVLRKHSKPAADMNSTIRNLIDGMTKIMYRNTGIGLAAPQVGVLKRVIIADIGDGLISLANPVILQHDGQDQLEEGCLSLPNIQVNINRNQSILVHGIDLQGKETDLEFNGLMARVIQHEIDHLNGVLIIDHASTVEKYLIHQQIADSQRQRNLL